MRSGLLLADETLPVQRSSRHREASLPLEVVPSDDSVLSQRAGQWRGLALVQRMQPIGANRLRANGLAHSSLSN